MKRYEEFSYKLQNVKEPNKSFILSLLKDFIWLDEQLEELRKYPRYKIHPNDPTRQIKLEVHSMIKDFQAQKNDIATKILRTLEGEEPEESRLVKLLKQFDE